MDGDSLDRALPWAIPKALTKCRASPQHQYWQSIPPIPLQDVPDVSHCGKHHKAGVSLIQVVRGCRIHHWKRKGRLDQQKGQKRHSSKSATTTGNSSFTFHQGEYKTEPSSPTSSEGTSIRRFGGSPSKINPDWAKVHAPTRSQIKTTKEV